MGRDRAEGAATDLFGSAMIRNGSYQEIELPDDFWLDSAGIFETLRTYGNRPFALDRHLRRLDLGLSELGIASPGRMVITEAIALLLEREPFPNGRIRIVVAGDGSWSITHHEYRPPKGELRCRLVQRSFSDEPNGQRFKRTDYRERFGIQRSALEAGFDDAILTNQDGALVEGTVCNLLLYIEDQWFTPSHSLGCLAGITRTLLIENFSLKEALIGTKDLGAVRSAAFISSLREVQGIKEIDGNLFPDSAPVEELGAIFHSWILGNLSS
ncbi:MAG: hypothetical protein RLZZ79_667 [Actinomycetota bacterium]